MRKFTFIVFVLFFTNAIDNKIVAQTKAIVKDTISVRGTCGMCKERIEEAVYKIAGVKEATWNKKTEVLTVIYSSKKTNLQKIADATAKFGHDNRLSLATAEQYKTLPDCCAYREGAKCAHD
jgi:periplasmic mercuric ion binding protein